MKQTSEHDPESDSTDLKKLEEVAALLWGILAAQTPAQAEALVVLFEVVAKVTRQLTFMQRERFIEDMGHILRKWWAAYDADKHAI